MMPEDPIPSPASILTSAIRAVPAVKYALGVGGIIAVGAVVMFVLMTVLVVFASLAGEHKSSFTEHKIVQTGCSTCQKHFGTVEQFKRHLSEDVLPPLLDRLSKSQ